MKSLRFRLPLLALAATLSAPGLAQQSPTYSQLDIRPAEATADLNSSLTRLAANPRDMTALIGAGEAALALNDPRAATGFFARADEIEANNGRVKAGLGRAMLELQNAAEALRLFDLATRLGAPEKGFVADRGLARDLTGDPAGAQRDYQAALRETPGDAEISRRYAVSLGISGQVDAADKAVEPLLYKSDRAAWRNRAFIYAMNGRQKEARDITHKVMPQQLADQIQPYMDRMPGLTPAQRAAAVHYGSFPSEGLRMAAAPVVAPPAAIAAPAPVQAAPATSRAAQGRQLARADTRSPVPVASARNPSAAPAPTASAPVSPTRSGAATPPPDANGAAANRVVAVGRQPSEQVAAARPTDERVSQRIDQRVGDAPRQIAEREAATAVAAQRQPLPGTTAPVASAIAPRSDAVQGPPASSAAPANPIYSAPVSTGIAAPAPSQPAATVPAPNPQATRTLADIMRELQVPDEEKQTKVAAVDLDEVAALQQQRRLARQAVVDKAKRDAAAKAKAEADAKAKAEAAEKARLARNPQRAWVQVGTGQNIAALGFTMKGLRKKYSALAAKDAWTAQWARTNRLVVGPFASFTKARAFEADLKKDGADAFAWQSDAGEEVSRLGGK